MPAYAALLLHTYYAQNYASIIRQGLGTTFYLLVTEYIINVVFLQSCIHVVFKYIITTFNLVSQKRIEITRNLKTLHDDSSKEL